ncbi:MAG TPA: FAD:protein FMN transferase [Vitreimonas sp.]|nr:FAD:protein FMN transferase [Vitreimonas sp.]
MTEFRFNAMGTAWSITLDGVTDRDVPVSLWDKVVTSTDNFEQRFSRFIEGSEVTAFRTAPAGTYPLSKELTILLAQSHVVRELTGGAFDPAIGTLLEKAGYDQQYSFHPQDQELDNWRLPGWNVDVAQQQVTISDAVVFDTGGIGKGYWIDQLSQLIFEAGYPYHLVDGGGDMVATTKENYAGWQVAIEWPGDQERAIGVVELHNQGFAASDIFRRRWGEWHHLINVTERQPVGNIKGCVAVAASAWSADQMTSALALVQPEAYEHIGHALGAEYLVLLQSDQAIISPQWPGEVF